MGFSVASSAIIVAAVFFVSAAVLAASLINAGVRMARILADTVYESAGPLASLTTLGNASLASDNVTLGFTLYNNGSRVLWDFEHSDLIVSYLPAGASEPLTVRLAYGDGWSVSYIVVNGGGSRPYAWGDGVLPSEAAYVVAVLPSPADRFSEVTLVFVNQYGGRAMYRFVPGAG